MNVLENKAEAMNTLNSWVNTVYPQFVREIKKGYKVKADGSLFAKDKPRFKSILDTKPFRAYLDYSKHSGLILVCDITYKTGEYSCNYYKHRIYLEQDFTPLRTDYTAKVIEAAMLEIRTLEAKKAKLRTQQEALRLEFDISY